MSHLPSRGETLSRRHFLKVGAMGALALSTVSTTALLTGCASHPPAAGFRFFRESDLRVMRALLPVVLAGRLPETAAEAVEGALHSLDEFLYGTSIAGHKQLRQLFDLLSMPVTRYAVAGLSSPWESVSTQEVRAFLDRWSHSRFQLLRAGYLGLTQMIAMGWYLQPQTWAGIGYVPPVVVVGEAA